MKLSLQNKCNVLQVIESEEDYKRHLQPYLNGILNLHVSKIDESMIVKIAMDICSYKPRDAWYETAHKIRYQAIMLDLKNEKFENEMYEYYNHILFVIGQEIPKERNYENMVDDRVESPVVLGFITMLNVENRDPQFNAHLTNLRKCAHFEVCTFFVFHFLFFLCFFCVFFFGIFLE